MFQTVNNLKGRDSTVDLDIDGKSLLEGILAK